VKPNSFKEQFAKFLESPSRELLRDVLKEQLGEQRNLDFKAEWPDTARLARHILGLANSGGGCLIVGICEREDKTLDISGLRALSDKADLANQIRNYLPFLLMEEVSINDFTYEASEYPKLVGKSFQVLIVPDNPENIPFLASKEAQDLKRTVVYVRRMASTEEATYEELQAVINRRIGTSHSNQRTLDLSSELGELRMLHLELERFAGQRFIANPVGDALRSQRFCVVGGAVIEKPDFETFVTKLILAKRGRIQQIMDD
jgi:predicted HTH transcriptional regulator